MGIRRRKAKDKAQKKNPEIIRGYYSSVDRPHSVAFGT